MSLFPKRFDGKKVTSVIGEAKEVVKAETAAAPAPVVAGKPAGSAAAAPAEKADGDAKLTDGAAKPAEPAAPVVLQDGLVEKGGATVYDGVMYGRTSKRTFQKKRQAFLQDK